MRGGDALNRHEADVVAIALVLFARIAEANEQFHDRTRAKKPA